MKQNTLTRICTCCVMLAALLCSAAFNVFADGAVCESAAIHGHYRHPVTQLIEDSAGESGEALGQSMVESMVDPSGLMESDENGNFYLSVRFHLMSNISKVELSVQAPGDTSWNAANWESTAKGEDSEDFRISIPSKDAVICARCFVDAMGREVTFFLTADQFEQGNPGGFVSLADKPVSAKNQTVSTIPANTVGLVTGGENSVQSNPAVGTTVSAPTQAQIGASVWVMFFVLVFCAQLLACAAFWGIKTWMTQKLEKRNQFQQPVQTPMDADDETFDQDFLDNSWEEEV